MMCLSRTSTTRSTTTARALAHTTKAISPTCTAGDLVLLNFVNYVSTKVSLYIADALKLKQKHSSKPRPIHFKLVAVY